MLSAALFAVFPVTLLFFVASLLLAMSASAWFTRRLEALCDLLDLSPGVLSILSALGANIPNYVASIDAFASHQPVTGLGIIVGSNIFNVAIILGLASIVALGAKGIRLHREEIADTRSVGMYATTILLVTLLLAWLLPGSPLMQRIGVTSLAATVLLITIAFVVLALFALFVLHIARRAHPAHAGKPPSHETAANQDAKQLSQSRLVAEIVLALALALGGVVVMVQSGQALTSELHLPRALAGLLVLAVATSLPNAVVVIILARTGRATACFEEIFSSNSINAALGVALPLLFWHTALDDGLLLILDAPLMVALTLAVLLCVQSGRISRAGGFFFLLCYALWVVAHML